MEMDENYDNGQFAGKLKTDTDHTQQFKVNQKEKSVQQEPNFDHSIEEDLEILKLTVTENQELLRIDKFLMNRLPNITRNKVQKGITRGEVLVNEQIVKPNYKIRPGDEIVIYLPEKEAPTDVIPQDIPLNIIYEDDQLLVINKEPGMVVHPGHNNWENTLVNALAYHFKDLPTACNGEDKPGIVHRIDKDTSGLLVIAKTDHAMYHLSRQFYYHTIDRMYYALVWGEPEEDHGTIEGYIGRSYTDRRQSMVYPEGEVGKYAVTHYRVLKRMRYVSLIQCQLETGRTHQIRVHMKSIGHTLFGDVMYGGNKVLKGVKTSKYKQFIDNQLALLPRQGLHAKTLGFIHPTTGKYMQFDSELPEDIHQVMERWENYVQYD
ncbi:RluA family pseudouridine synthase [Sediminitomix flava]|uniref:Pseudouridine synthase n=1 Tax=Sediminitomix flava TaxID=379075 RepID=A0A315ZGR0_SEDFL|nr:RluA family pseudouridine synthase [Sediminitomix flava]PWJ44310.1 ribosomal large subunit pseudouridine synthase D [Sediminitomix flava]